MNELYGHRCGRCGGFSNEAEHKIIFSPDALAKGLEAIFNGFKVKDEIQGDIFREMLRLFNMAAAVGLSETAHPEELTDSFLEQVRHNNEVFSAFRTHRMQNDLAKQLVDSKGQLKSFQQFSRDVEPLTGKYCRTWLQTEYETAVIRAHNAADWKHFEAEKDVYPNLRWMPTTSAMPDPVHASFWSRKLTLPVDDSFWGHHHPGERWGCKCTCEQTDEAVNDLGMAGDYPDTANKGLHGNPAKTGKLFSEDHPYYPKNCGSCPFSSGTSNALGLFFNVKRDCSNCQVISRYVKSSHESYDIGRSLTNLYNLDNKHFVDEVKKITSSKIFKSVAKDIFSAIGESDPDYKRLLDVCMKASRRGYRSFILPNPSTGRTPDIILERKGVFKVYDVKTIVGKNSVSNRLHESVGQTRRVILHITTDYQPRKLATEIKSFMYDNPETTEVLVFHGGKQVSVTPNMLTENFEKVFASKYIGKK